MSAASDFTAELAGQGIRLMVAGDRLRYEGPKSALTPEILVKLRDLKSELLPYLRDVGAINGAKPPIPILPAGTTPPMSLVQERLWFLYQMNGPTPDYNIPTCRRLRGPLDLDAFRNS